jgi:hypothetical protein
MIFKTIHGSLKRIPKVKKYLLDWDSKSRSKIQFKVKQYLKKYWSNNVVFEEFPVAGTRLTLDFYNASKNIAVEVQGQQHRKYVPFFHQGYKNNYIDQLRRDKQKAEFCTINNIKLIEVYDTDKIDKTLFKKLGVEL